MGTLFLLILCAWAVREAYLSRVIHGLRLSLRDEEARADYNEAAWREQHRLAQKTHHALRQFTQLCAERHVERP